MSDFDALCTFIARHGDGPVGEPSSLASLMPASWVALIQLPGSGPTAGWSTSFMAARCAPPLLLTQVRRYHNMGLTKEPPVDEFWVFDCNKPHRFLKLDLVAMPPDEHVA